METYQRASWTEQEKGSRNRDWLQKTRELVGRGGWINKTMLSASLGPAGNIKWVDMSRWVSPFSPSSSPSIFFFFFLSSIWSPLPLPHALLRSLQKWPLTHTRQCKHPTFSLIQFKKMPSVLSYLRFDHKRLPFRTGALRCHCSAFYQDVIQIIRGDQFHPNLWQIQGDKCSR